MNIKTIIDALESVAPRVYQESYDNAGLIVGNSNSTCTGVLTCLDSTEAVIDEAIAKQCNLVVAHHPIVFKGLKKFTGKTYVERVILKAIKNDIAIYAIHTNLDNVYVNGVNSRIIENLGLINHQILAPKSTLQSLTAYVSMENAPALKEAFLHTGANVQTEEQSLRNISVGSFPQQTDPSVRIAMHVIFSKSQQFAIESLLKNFSNLDYTIQTVSNKNSRVGSGMIGDLKKPMTEIEFLTHIKNTFKTDCIKHTKLLDKPVKKVAVCGGAGGFLLQNAIAQKADVFITSDYKYHEFFDADSKIIIADIGHFESEQSTILLLSEIIREKFGNFAVHCTTVNTNPVQYFT